MILFGIILMMSGCGTAKRTKTEEKKTENNSLNVNEISTSSANVNFSYVKENDSSLEEKEEVYEYDGEPGDSLKIIKKGPDGGILFETILTGKGKGKISTKSKTETTRKNEKEDSKSNRQESNQIQIKTEKTAVSTTIKKEKESPDYKSFLWIIILIISLIIYLKWNLNKKT